MIPMTLREVARVAGGHVEGDADVVVSGAAYLDSRAPVPGGLFVALAGDRVDGHECAAGAHAVLGSRATAAPTVVVRDPMVGLARLARHVVDAVRPTVLAVTGSNGKTGTKDHLATLLPGGLVTAGNLNNELGVPITCLGLRPSTEQLVLEMGARGIGHLSWLCEIAPPTVAAVLGVGTAHVGQFGSTELTACAKGELVEALDAGGTAVLNADDPRVAAMAARTVARVLTFGATGEVTWRSMALDELGRPSFELGYGGAWTPVRLTRVGAHQVTNATAAAAMALAVGEPLDAIAARLSRSPAASPHRMQLRFRRDGLLVLDDTYNANPESVAAALDTLVAVGRRRPGRTVAVLGEMRELGGLAFGAHRAVGRHARELGVDVVVSVGAAAAGIALAAGGLPMAGRDDALAWLADELEPGDAVLVKGSRAGGLEALVDALLTNGRMEPWTPPGAPRSPPPANA
ncbi:MAG: UDP-N-acetylmuramoyl-tripeptide--D-alanyl-D-alanine ligase [Nocardioidaceae bacterium]|nr:UDP-N-acetylmuramoyl-tripeptide--D-alanyl-D-alanine ligase [Nocardioidaceae bacterium]